MTNLRLTRPVAFIDVETTGTNTLSDRIVELSALKIYPDETEEIITTRINPGIPIPPEAIAIHSITDKDVADKPNFKEYAATLRDFLEGCDLAGFNVRRFDLDIIEAEFRRAEIEFSIQGRHIVDVQTIYHRFEPRDLPAAYKKYCGKVMEVHHSSESDVRATFDVLKSQLEKHPNDLPNNINELHDFCNEKRSINWIDKDGKFVWVGDEAVVNFSKYRGKTLSHMAKNERSFLEWIINKDFSPEVKKIAEDAIKGKFPQKD
mgnify:CR=1 FL=1